MDPIMLLADLRQYKDFEPKTEVVSGEGAETLLVHLPEFKKEQLRVQLTPTRILRISGERPLAGNKWTRFMKEVSVPQYCDAKDISAKFERGVLSARQPKLITPAEPQETAKPAVEARKPQPAQAEPQETAKPAVEAPKPQPAQTLQPKPASEPAQAEPQEKEHQKKEKEEEVGHETWEDAKESFDEHAKSARGGGEAETGKKHEEEWRDKEETGGKPAAAEGWMSEMVFKEVKKPGYLKMLAVVVMVAMVVTLQVAYGGVWYHGQHTTGMDRHSRKVVWRNYEQIQNCHYGQILRQNLCCPYLQHRLCCPVLCCPVPCCPF